MPEFHKVTINMIPNRPASPLQLMFLGSLCGVQGLGIQVLGLGLRVHNLLVLQGTSLRARADARHSIASAGIYASTPIH